MGQVLKVKHKYNRNGFLPILINYFLRLPTGPSHEVLIVSANAKNIKQKETSTMDPPPKGGPMVSSPVC
jgi:hypothetical protein